VSQINTRLFKPAASSASQKEQGVRSLGRTPVLKSIVFLSNCVYQGMIFLNPFFFLLLDSFLLSLLSPWLPVWDAF
jgi:hypothetical protein